MPKPHMERSLKLIASYKANASPEAQSKIDRLAEMYSQYLLSSRKTVLRICCNLVSSDTQAEQIGLTMYDKYIKKYSKPEYYTISSPSDEEVDECCVCLTDKADVVLDCKHAVCSECRPKLDKCPLCRKLLQVAPLSREHYEEKAAEVGLRLSMSDSDLHTAIPPIDDMIVVRRRFLCHCYADSDGDPSDYIRTYHMYSTRSMTQGEILVALVRQDFYGDCSHRFYEALSHDSFANVWDICLGS